MTSSETDTVLESAHYSKPITLTEEIESDQSLKIEEDSKTTKKFAEEKKIKKIIKQTVKFLLKIIRNFFK